MGKTLRPYQESAVTAIFDYFDAGNTGNPVVVAPVGAGKSLLIAEFIRRACTLFPGTRIMVVSHVSELITQTAEELLGQWPEASISFYAAKLGRKSLSGDVILATIQSVFGRAYNLTRPVDLVLVDECHLISPKQSTMYQRLFADLKVVNRHLKVIGFTGTPFRSTEGTLIEGEGRIFTDIAYQIPMLYLIEKGYLCPPITPPMKTQMPVEGVKLRDGDYVEGQLQKAVDKTEITVACVDEIIEHGRGRKKWIVFTAGVEHCEHVRDEIRSRGISCEMLTGRTPTHERHRIVSDYKADRIQCLVNVAVLTTGFNVPAIDLLAFMRPTRSPVLYIQCCGRAIRTFPGKTDALILDFGGVVESLGPLDLVDVKKAHKGTGDAPVKVCPECHAVCFAGVHFCPDCNFEFERGDPFKDMVARATSAPALSIHVEPEWHAVTGMSTRKHQKDPAKPPCLRVTYHTITGRFEEFICFEHSGFAREKAVAWHKTKALCAIPNTIDEALEIEYPEPTRVLVRQEGKWWRVVRLDYKKSGDVLTRTDEGPSGPRPELVDMDFEIPF